MSNDYCPKCGGDLLHRKGPHGSFYGCSNYPNCKYKQTSLWYKKRAMRSFRDNGVVDGCFEHGKKR